MAPLALAALDRLEQERRVGALVRRDQTPVREHGRELVGEQAHRHRDRRDPTGRAGLLRQLHEFIAAQARHGRMVRFTRRTREPAATPACTVTRCVRSPSCS